MPAAKFGNGVSPFSRIEIPRRLQTGDEQSGLGRKDGFART